MLLADSLKARTLIDLQSLLSTFRHSTSHASPSGPLPATATASSPSLLHNRTVSAPPASSLPQCCLTADAHDIFHRRHPSSLSGPPRPLVSLSRWLHALDSEQALSEEQAGDDQQGRPPPDRAPTASTAASTPLPLASSVARPPLASSALPRLCPAPPLERATFEAREPRTGLQEQLAAAGFL